MEYIKVEYGVIKGHFCGKNLPDGHIAVPDGFVGSVGMNLAELTDDLRAVKPLSQRVKEGSVEQPEGMKVNEHDNEFVRMEQHEIDAIYPVKTFAVEGEYQAIPVQKTFDRFGNFGYYAPEGTVEMDKKQPSFAHKAVKGKWVFDLERGKQLKLSELSAAYSAETDNAHCTSSLGFEIDADEKADKAISGLVLTTKDGEEIQFCDYHNEFHPVTLDGLKTMQTEVINHANRLKAQKWAYRQAINTSQTEQELAAIEINFGACRIIDNL